MGGGSGTSLLGGWFGETVGIIVGALGGESLSTAMGLSGVGLVLRLTVSGVGFLELGVRGGVLAGGGVWLGFFCWAPGLVWRVGNSSSLSVRDWLDRTAKAFWVGMFGEKLILVPLIALLGSIWTLRRSSFLGGFVFFPEALELDGIGMMETILLPGVG